MISSNTTDSTSPSLHPDTASGTLYIVATPIGNLGDMTYRAVQILQTCQLIACEDTRTSRVLCERYSIKTPLSAYHEHNAQAVTPSLIGRLQEGQSLALISDAGTPLISDPGYRLVNAAIAAGHLVVPVPGPSSIIAALSASGLPTDRFYFSGFLPPKQQARIHALQTLSAIDATLIMLESNNRIVDTLHDMQTIFRERPVVIARELTKRFEEFSRGTPETLYADYAARTAVKGEIVLMVAPPVRAEPELMQADALIHALLPFHPVKHIAQLLADALALPKNAVYSRAQYLKEASRL